MNAKGVIKSLLIIWISYYSNEAKCQESDFVPGQLFVKVKKQKSKSQLEFELFPLITAYGIKAIERAFKLENPELEKVFALEFDSISKTTELIKQLNHLDVIKYAEQVPLYHFFHTPNDLNSQQWNLKVINAEQAWNYTQGSPNVVIAIVDDAIQITHEDLANNIWVNPGEIPFNGIDDDSNGYIDDINGWDIGDNDNDPNPIIIPSNPVLEHGTHCAGIASAVTGNTKGIASIGYTTKVMAVKCSADFGNGGLSDPYLGVEYAIAAKADIISMSWGGPTYSNTYQLLFDYANSQGIVLIAAAGNSNTSLPMYPASYNHVISVGSTTINNKKSSFSNYGLTIDLMAPGSGILSTIPEDKYDFKSGTSMSCPLVAGLVALLIARDPAISPDAVEICLKSSTQNIDPFNPLFAGQLGAGQIDAAKAMNCIQTMNANFSVEFRQVCPGQADTFYDKTTLNPISWLWSFPGGTPSTSTFQNPLVTYNSPGIYDVTLIVSDGVDFDTITKTNYIEVGTPLTILANVPSNTYVGLPTYIEVNFSGNPPWSLTYLLILHWLQIATFITTPISSGFILILLPPIHSCPLLTKDVREIYRA